eukprot:634615-Hanusia_phi.AAC.2
MQREILRLQNINQTLMLQLENLGSRYTISTSGVTKSPATSSSSRYIEGTVGVYFEEQPPFAGELSDGSWSDP